MSRISADVSREAAMRIDARSVEVAVDVGGASGTLIHALLQQNPALQGVVYDPPHVAACALKAAEALGLKDRLSVVSGDFFASVPPVDLYLLKSVLHDWGNEACISILKSCRRAIKPGGRIVVVEMAVDDINTPGIAPVIDLTMLVLLGGRQRSLDEYKTPFAAADFCFSSAAPTSTPSGLIEAIAI
jgi:hypothetical protein